MTEFSGSLQAIELSASLWLIPLLPLLVAALSALKRAAPDEDEPQPLSAHWHLEAALGALALLGFELFELLTLPVHRRFLLDTLGSVLRIGSLEVDLSLSLDPLSAVAGLLVAVCGAVAIAHISLPHKKETEPATARRLEALSLGLGSMLLLVLASNLAMLLVGWGAASLAGYLLLSGRGGVAFALGRFADLALLAGAALLFWTLGGAWSRSGEYMPDFRARVVAVEGKLAPLTDQQLEKPSEKQQREAPRIEASGKLSFNALPGATVRIGGATLCEIGDDGQRGGLGVPSRPCRVAAHSPFERVPVPLAVQDFHIDLGAGANPLRVEKVRVQPDAQIQLAVAGSTLDFREMRDQLAMRDKAGDYALQTALLDKKLWGLPALTLALLLIVLAALAKSAQWPLGGGSRERDAALLTGGGGLVAGAYLVARFRFYLPLAPTAGGLLALFGSITALLVGLFVLLSRDPRRIALGFAVGQVGLALIGIGSGALAAGVLELLVVVPAAVVLLRAAEDVEHALGTAPDLARLGGLGTALPRTARAWFIASLAATAAPYPALGAFWSRESLFWGAFTGGNTGPVPGAVLVVFGVLGGTALCFAVWRAYFLLFTGKSAGKKRPRVKTPPPEIRTRILLGLAWLSLLVGLLGASDSVLDSAQPAFPALMATWLAPLIRAGNLSFAPLGTGMRLGLLLVGFGVPLLAWSAARRRYGPGREKNWLEAERGMKLFAWLERGDPVPRLTAPVGRGVIALGAALGRLDDVLAFGGGSESADDDEKSESGSGDADDDDADNDDPDDDDPDDDDESKEGAK
jgi:NADH:ubiquinone oxidoreductase subunit 5 (subunit L)/multisubunit Na+/H+ antiporter MnhA subunit